MPGKIAKLNKSSYDAKQALHDFHKLAAKLINHGSKQCLSATCVFLVIDSEDSAAARKIRVYHVDDVIVASSWFRHHCITLSELE